MRKIILLSSMLFLIGIYAHAQTTATDFTATDCAGNSHNLFAELNSGKVVVIVWVMPCGSCIGPAQAAYDDVQTFASSHPGRVVFYLADDYADDACDIVAPWGSANGLDNAYNFSSAALNPANYGTVGMPKIVVLGGWNHKVFYNENDGNNPTGLSAALSQAYSASGIEESKFVVSELDLTPNIIQNNATLTYILQEKNNVTIDVLNALGGKVKTLSIKNQVPGKNILQLNFETYADGIYFLRLSIGEKNKVLKFSVVH